MRTYLVVPTSRLSSMIRLRLTEDGSPIITSRVVTARELVATLFNDNVHDAVKISDTCSQLVTSSVIPSNQDRLELLRPPKSATLQLANELSEYRSTLMMHNISPGADGIGGRKGDEVSLICREYLALLSRLDLADQETAVSSILEKAESGRNLGVQNVVFYGFFEPPPLIRDLMLAVIRGSQRSAYYLPFSDGPAFKDDGAWLGIADVTDLADSVESTARSSIFSQSVRDMRGELEVCYTRDRLSEVRMIASKIRGLIQEGCPPGQVAVIFPQRDRDISFVSEVFADYGLPLFSAYATPLSQAAIVRAILDLVSIPASSYERERVVSFLNSPLSRFSWVSGGQRFRISPLDVDELSREACVFEGRDSWHRLLRRLEEDWESQARSPCTSDGRRAYLGRNIEKLRRTSEGLSEMFASLSELEAGETLESHVNALCGQLRTWRFDQNLASMPPHLQERESRAYDSFMHLLDELRAASNLVGDFKLDLRQFCAILTSLVSTTRYNASEENSNAVQLVGLRESPHLSYDHVFIADVVEGELPRVSIERPLMTDEEAAQMGLLSRKDILRQERYYFLAALMTGKKGAHLSYSQSDGTSPLIPSCFLESVCESGLIEPQFVRDFPGSSILSQAEEGRALASGEYDSETMCRTLPVRVGGVLKRINAELVDRKGGYITPHDCVLSAEPDIQEEMTKIFGDGRIYSARQLEAYALCPFKFFLENVARVKVIPDVERDFTPLDRGLMFHSIAFRFYTELKELCHGNVPHGLTKQEAFKMLSEIAEDEIGRYAGKDIVSKGYRGRLLGGGHVKRGVLQDFVDGEYDERWSRFEPTHFELSFGGRTGSAPQDPASTTEPVLIDLGPAGPEKVRLRGRVDRVDLIAPDMFVILDYKTGARGGFRKSERSALEFQLPLYLMALEGFFGDRRGIAGMMYHVRNVGEVRRRVDIGDKDLSELLNWNPRYDDPDLEQRKMECRNGVKSCIQGMRKGEFHPSLHYEKCPSYCDFRTVCRYDPLRLIEVGGGGRR